MNRRPRHLRDGVSLGWLAGAVVVSLVHRWVPAASWLMIHLVLLGALSHAALVWSEHFAHTLLRRVPDTAGVVRQEARIVLLGVGSLAVFVGLPADLWWLVVVGAAVAAASLWWHAAHLWAELRRALPNRFRVVTRYYIAAALCLPVGAGFGAALALGLGDAWQGRLLVAHLVTNLLGWIGLTLTGTLVTFWPTLVRARMDDRAEQLARQALPVLIAGVAVVAFGALAGWQPVALAGLAVYAAGLCWWGRALASPLRAKGLREFAPASVLAALVWGAVGIVWVGWLLVTTGWEALPDAVPIVAGIFAAGFAAQLLTGALSYLVPSVLGGGPSVVRAGQAWLNRGATFRLVVINAGLLLFLLPAPSWVRVTLSTLVLAALASFLPLVVLGARASASARRAQALDAALDRAGAVVAAPATRPGPVAGAARASAFRSPWSWGGLIAGVTALVVAVTLGVGADPATAGLSGLAGVGGPAASTESTVTPTGRTTRVEVTAQGMTFTPNRVSVPRGDRLVIVLTNADDTNAHDLLIGSVRTPRLRPGQTVELDAGVVGASTQGWCTVAGHRQMGMVFDVVVTGDEPAAQPHATASGHSSTVPATGASLDAAVDPVLPPLTDERVHRVQLTVTEVALAVAPGIWQTRWTYNGGSVGPTLHGRVGDVFEVTLVNDGSIGHSIDFHAGSLAPDVPMRTIAPGESLVYRFTAVRAGVWMYHCSTMPMSAHIAAGMHGAVIIEPDGLAPVDRSYALVQSEVYLAGSASGPAEAAEVDVDKVSGESPDRVVFNGVANQYDQYPLTARVGERVRVWVLDAGPNRASAFHIVGAQFDTVWTEGDYTLRPGSGGGAQVLPLQPAQGGFVELVFDEAGRYPLVSHVMVDAERGAHGFVQVGP